MDRSALVLCLLSREEGGKVSLGPLFAEYPAFNPPLYCTTGRGVGSHLQIPEKMLLK